MSAYALTHESLRGDVPPAGTTIGPYRVEKTIGAGGLGVVLEAVHVTTGRRVAIKVLPLRAAADPEAVVRFRRETRAAAKIGSDHVVRVIDSGDLDSGLPYLVMEHLEGTSLAELLEQAAPLRVDDVVDWVLQAIHGIKEAHALGIVHRDLKPANLFLAPRASGPRIVKVLDFGAAKVTDGSPLDAETGGSVTVATSLIGSPRYMAPEQIRSALEVDARADVYALGATLHELLTGKPLFAADTLARIFAQVLWDVPEPVSNGRPDVPSGLDAVVARCLAKDRSERFPSVKELAAALAPFASPAGRLLAAELTGATEEASAHADALAAAPSAERTATTKEPAKPAPAKVRAARLFRSNAEPEVARAARRSKRPGAPSTTVMEDAKDARDAPRSSGTMRLDKFVLARDAAPPATRTMKLAAFVLAPFRPSQAPPRPTSSRTVRMARFDAANAMGPSDAAALVDARDAHDGSARAGWKGNVAALAIGIVAFVALLTVALFAGR